MLLGFWFGFRVFGREGALFGCFFAIFSSILGKTFDIELPGHIIPEDSDMAPLLQKVARGHQRDTNRNHKTKTTIVFHTLFMGQSSQTHSSEHTLHFIYDLQYRA